MIEATCAACGMVNRIAEADVPVGAKFVSCTSCKSKVALPAKAAIPPIPSKIPTPPKGVPAPKNDALGLADLPAPKRQSPLAGTEAGSPKPAPRSALAGAELPVPKGTAKPPAPQPGALDLDDLMPPADAPSSFAGLADLPAPKGKTPALGAPALADLPAPKGKTGSGPSVSDLPAPKRKTPGLGTPALADVPRNTPGMQALDDLLAPNTDLPTPKTPPRGVPAGLADLPAPKAKSAGLADLPTPKAKTPPAGVPSVPGDLPAPKRKTPPAGVPTPPAAKKSTPALTDVPTTPAGTLELDDLDLPMPVAGVTDLPTPKPGANNDLLAPKGFFDDLPQPAKKSGNTIDLPAPKGFFDDLPQPAPKQSQSPATQDVAPKGFFDDLPQPAPKQSQSPATQDVAPKGFFDDLPQPAAKQTQDVAPKGGFFDDLPQPNQGRSTKQSVGGGGGGLFDDLAEPNKGGLFDDLQPPGSGPSAANAAMGAGDIDLGPALDGPGLELAGNDAPELDLGGPLGGDNAFQDLDLSDPSKPPPEADPSPIKIKTPAKGAEKKPIPIHVPPPKGADMKLDLAEDPHSGKPAAATALGGPKIAPKKKAAVAAESAEARAAKRRRSRLVLASLLGVVALGAGGFYFYQRHTAKQARLEEISTLLAKAEKALRADDPTHWDRARSAAEEAVALDATNARALGIAAEASIAGALENGRNRDMRIANARKMIQDSLGAGRTSPELERAQAVAAIAAKGQGARAVDMLKGHIARAPKDGYLQLYMGWAQLAKGDAAEANKAFEQAITLTPGTKLPALYGQGQAKLLVADVEGARAAFGKILEIDKDHVCANVGLIATKPPSESTLQVQELEAVLQRKDIASADPRCVVQAHTLVGDVHRLAGRNDMARQRYRDALKLVSTDIASHDGLAAVELRDNKLSLAADHIAKALAVQPDHPETLLLQAELKTRQGKLPEAQAIVDTLSKREPPLPTLAQARLHVAKGKLFEAQGEHEKALEEFEAGAKLAGELDLTPAMEVVKKAGELAKKETDAAKATLFRDRADKAVASFAERAQDDALIATTLGIAYLQTDNPAKAELFLRRATALKEDDAEPKIQLAKACYALGKYDDAITQLQAAQKLDPKRPEIPLELARTMQAAGRHDDAVAAYDKLLGAPEVSTVVRVNAGRYFAQRGLIDRAAAQGDAILAVEADNPGGLYLKAEGLIKAGKPEDATPLLIKASDVDPDVQYLDALGRSYEAQLVKSGDTKYVESARFAYERASKADEKMFHPWLGQGRALCHPKRGDWEAAIVPLERASKINASHPEVRYYMGVAYYGLRNRDKKYKATAAGWLESALRSQPELPTELRAEASWMLAILHQDLNNVQGRIAALERATRLGEEIEKNTAKAPQWLNEAFYGLGDMYGVVGNMPGKKRAWQRFVERSPRKDTAQYKAANHALATELQRY
jgi:tetratricopeptide (TPR) repeat protein